MPITANNPFKGRHPGELIILCVRLYLRYPLSYEHVAEFAAERGVEVDASCIWRWVHVYSPELNKRCRSHLKPANKSYRIDETYIKVEGEDKYLYRAVDSTGQTIDFLLTAKRDTTAAKRFLRNAIEASGNGMPRVVNVDKNPAYPAAVEALKADSVIPGRVVLRQCKYLNNVIEQDHRALKGSGANSHSKHKLTNLFLLNSFVYGPSTFPFYIERQATTLFAPEPRQHAAGLRERLGRLPKLVPRRQPQRPTGRSADRGVVRSPSSCGMRLPSIMF